MSDPAQVQSGAHFGDHLHGVRPGGRSVCISSSETPLTGFHDNPASCHSGADGVRNFRPVYFRVLALSGGGSPLVLKAGFCGFCACSFASRSFLRRPWASAFPRPSAQPRPGLPLGPPPRDVTSWSSVSGSPLAPEYWFRSLAAGRSGESPAGPGSGGGRGSFLLPPAGASSAAVLR